MGFSTGGKTTTFHEICRFLCKAQQIESTSRVCFDRSKQGCKTICLIDLECKMRHHTLRWGRKRRSYSLSDSP